MQPTGPAKNAVPHATLSHSTIEDVSWDLGSIEHRVAQLENVVKQMKADVSQLQAKLRDVGQECRPSEQDSSSLFQENDLAAS